MATRKKTQPSVQRREPLEEIYADEYIQVMNICPMPLTLSTESLGKGRTYNFLKFGEIKRIVYGDLVRIMDSASTFLEKGFFYIMDDRVVRKHGFTGIYDQLLTKEKLDKIFDMGVDAYALYSSATENQRKFIDTMLVRRVRDDEFVDFNLLAKILKNFGVDIVEKGRTAKEMTAEAVE